MCILVSALGTRGLHFPSALDPHVTKPALLPGTCSQERAEASVTLAAQPHLPYFQRLHLPQTLPQTLLCLRFYSPGTQLRYPILAQLQGSCPPENQGVRLSEQFPDKEELESEAQP